MSTMSLFTLVSPHALARCLFFFYYLQFSARKCSSEWWFMELCNAANNIHTIYSMMMMMICGYLFLVIACQLSNQWLIETSIRYWWPSLKIWNICLMNVVACHRFGFCLANASCPSLQYGSIFPRILILEFLFCGYSPQWLIQLYVRSQFSFVRWTFNYRKPIQN